MSTTQDLAGKHALVCGASAGIGRATALALAAAGAEVTVLARSEEALAALCGELSAAGASAARYLAVDLNELVVLSETLDAFLAEHGPVHVLINNSGGPPAGHPRGTWRSTGAVPGPRHRGRTRPNPATLAP